ncbi:hypothetical protein C7M61_000400 [Candidozyma pseudohaemuli]|uniref:Uncharacterized protein n=1 Tax=Candidozyma pseudohaemuli TaxID=418784 RepID=A0A2P7YXR0_9ASCO|nr:hypothetical protein C7M61_000400 [[Candida] pseudohaemulonii]PSK40748.1 hypothetical protein C7M61_000400 [[Candida] pseudohaemulonii]
MSQTWIRGPLCGIDNCRSRLYRTYAGRKICQYGHVVEGNVEFGDDDGENYTQTRRINLLINDTGFGSSVSTSAVPTQPSTPLEKVRLYGKEARSLHFKIGQLVLQKIIPMILKELVPGDQLFQQNVALLTKIFWVRYCKKAFDLKSPTILDLYVLVYLAMRQLNQHPVYVDDFLSLLRHNKTPFINGSSLIPQSFIQQSNLATRLFSASSIPIDNQFYLKIVQLALIVAPAELWKTPLEVFYPGAFRVFTDLSFKDAPRLLTMFHRIGFRVTEGQLSSSWKQHSTLPETQYVALLVLVIKIYFTAAPEVPSHEEWLARLKNNTTNIPCFDTKHHSMSIKSALDMSTEDTSQYFDWIQSNLIPENRITQNDDLPLTTRKLYKIFSLDEPQSREELPWADNPLDLVKNTLTTQQIVLISEQLQSYFCVRFGLTSKTLSEATERVEFKFYKTLKADGAIIK